MIAADTHAHLFLLKPSLAEIIKRADAANVKYIINVGFSIKTSIKAYDMAKEYPEKIFPTIGIHPHECNAENNLEAIPELINKTKNSPINYRAIGEIGLDYFRNTVDKNIQQHYFLTQLQFASELNLPVIIHNREADADVLEIITKFPALPKVFHCYSTNIDFALRALSPSHYFSFTGNITYKNKKHILEVIKKLPLEKIMIETDCPYITPMIFKGQENEPYFVIEVAKKIAEVKNLSLKEVVNQTTINAKKFFKI